MPLLFAAALVLLPPCSLPPNLASRHRPPPLSSAAVVIRRCRCHCPPPSLSTAANILPPQPSLPHHVSAISCRPLLSFPFVVCRPILHAVVIRRCLWSPLPPLSPAAVFRRRSHHRHSTIPAVSHCLLSSFPIAVCCPIMRVVVICHHRHPPP
jgi:hypothetical protein